MIRLRPPAVQENRAVTSGCQIACEDGPRAEKPQTPMAWPTKASASCIVGIERSADSLWAIYLGIGYK